MSPTIKTRVKRTAIFSLIALCVGAIIGWMQIQSGATPASMPIAGIKIGGKFTLTDHTGKTVTDRDFAKDYKLIYFGFTYCPAICPTELRKIADVMEKLKGKAQTVQPLFITVDPERDTPKILKNYVALFHPRLIGLTGTAEQISDVLKSFKIYAKKSDDPASNDYTVDHSSFIYFLGPGGEALGIYRMSDTADFIAADVDGKI